MNREIFEDMSRFIDNLDEGCKMVVKGAFVLDALLREEVQEPLQRKTRDIDMNCNEEITQEELDNLVKRSITLLNKNLEVECIRPFSENRSAGYRVNENGTPYFDVDISLKRNMFYKDYLTVINTKIKGSTKERIISDKVTAISTPKIFRRSKDLYDLFLLTFLENIETKNLAQPLKENILGNFEEFHNRRDDLEYSYNKLQGINNKPNFNAVYSRVFDFVSIISKESEVNLKWNPVLGMWEVE